MVARKALQLKENQARNFSIMEDYLTNPKLGLSDVVVMAADFLLAGIDTV